MANNYGYIRFNGWRPISRIYATSANDEKRTNRLFRDTHAWYHIVLRVDTTKHSW